MKVRIATVLFAAWFLAMAGPAAPVIAGMGTHRAIAVLHPTEGSNVNGTVVFAEVDGGVQVIAELQGLSPGNHGFHIHEFGDCSAPDATSAGGHFNPMGSPHAGPEDAVRHAGDLGNILAGSDGKARLEWVDPVLRLSGQDSVVGRAVVVHAGEDDLASQPSGNAGPRVACGVVGFAK
jgi:Cu-Zn family superoxide dismutase